MNAASDEGKFFQEKLMLLHLYLYNEISPLLEICCNFQVHGRIQNTQNRQMQYFYFTLIKIFISLTISVLCGKSWKMHIIGYQNYIKIFN